MTHINLFNDRALIFLILTRFSVTFNTKFYVFHLKFSNRYRKIPPNKMFKENPPPIVSKTIGSNIFLNSSCRQLLLFNIMRFEFEITVHYRQRGRVAEQPVVYLNHQTITLNGQYNWDVLWNVDVSEPTKWFYFLYCI